MWRHVGLGGLLFLLLAAPAPAPAQDRPAGPDLVQTAFLTLVTRQGMSGAADRLWSGRFPSTPMPTGEEPVIDHTIAIPPRSELHLALVLASPDVAEFYFTSNSAEFRVDLGGAELTESGVGPLARIDHPLQMTSLPGGVLQTFVTGADVPGGKYVLHDRCVQGQPALFRWSTLAFQDPKEVLKQLAAGSIKPAEMTDAWLAARDRAWTLRVPCRVPGSKSAEILEFSLTIALRWAPKQ